VGIGWPADKPFASTVSPRSSDAAWIKAMSKDAKSERLRRPVWATANDAVSKRLRTCVQDMKRRQQERGDDVGATFSQAAVTDYGLLDHVFKLFRLDRNKPHDHQVLLCSLVHIIFGLGRAGAPKKWGGLGARPSLDQLKADIGAVIRGGTKWKSVREICRLLKEDKDKRFEGRYADIGPEALRHRVRKLLGGN
jgi:hypothetical protein